MSISSKIKKTFISLSTGIIASVGLFSGLGPINVSAAIISDLGFATSNFNLNQRDINCNKIGLLKLGTAVKINSEKFIKCTVNGKVYNMAYVFSYANGSNSYVANDFLINTGSEKDESNYEIKTTANVNFRNETCGRISTIPNGTSLTYLGFESMTFINCKINGVNYTMKRIGYKNVTGYVAINFIK